MLEAILILACFVSGFLTRGFYDSVRDRRRKNKPIDVEYTAPSEFRLNEVGMKEGAIGFPDFEDMK